MARPKISIAPTKAKGLSKKTAAQQQPPLDLCGPAIGVKKNNVAHVKIGLDKNKVKVAPVKVAKVVVGVEKKAFKKTLVKAKEIVKVVKPHRYRPGTRARMEVRRYQKGTQLLVLRSHAERIARQVLNDKEKPMRLAGGALHSVMVLVEDVMHTMLRDAHTRAVDAGKASITRRLFVRAVQNFESGALCELPMSELFEIAK